MNISLYFLSINSPGELPAQRSCALESSLHIAALLSKGLVNFHSHQQCVKMGFGPLKPWVLASLIISANLISELHLILILICSSLIINKVENFSLLLGHLYSLFPTFSACVQCSQICWHRPPPWGTLSISLLSGAV